MINGKCGGCQAETMVVDREFGMDICDTCYAMWVEFLEAFNKEEVCA